MQDSEGPRIDLPDTGGGLARFDDRVATLPGASAGQTRDLARDLDDVKNTLEQILRHLDAIGVGNTSWR